MVKAILYSSTGCPYCAKMKEEFKQWGLEYEERNVTDNPTYFNDLHEKGIFSTPVVFVDDKTFIGYRPNAMKKHLGIVDAPKSPATTDEQQDYFVPMKEEILQEEYDLVIIGGGPAGATAAIYGARGKLKTLLLDKAPAAGTLAITHKIANYPGIFEELSGYELLKKFHRHAKEFGAQLIRTQVTGVDFTKEIKEIKVPEGTIKAKSVFIAVGAKGRASKLEGEDEFLGRGVSYCTTCDAAFYQGKVVAVVGETEEAVSEAISVSRFADKVLFMIPKDKLSGEVNIDEANAIPNIEVLWKHRVKAIKGSDRFEGLLVKDPQGEEKIWDVNGVFLYLSGTKPGTEFLRNAVALDEEGFVQVDEFLRTDIPGVFAGGDARKQTVKQAVVAAADGAIAAQGADQYVNKRRVLVPQYI